MIATMKHYPQLDRLCAEHGLLALYLFGSRADEGLARLEGRLSNPGVEDEGSDLDIGVVFRGEVDVLTLNRLQVALEDLFEPWRVDLVPLQKVDALFQFDAIDGHRVAAPDPIPADYYELAVMRSAADLLPIQRQLERDLVGVSTE
jgi:predicted nucleotidyltransferase